MQTKRDKTIIRKIVRYHVSNMRRLEREGKRTPAHALDLMRLIACRSQLRFSDDPIPVARIER